MRNHFILKRMADDSLFLIDIDKVLREKAPKYYKYIPKFVVSYLKRNHEFDTRITLSARCAGFT